MLVHKQYHYEAKIWRIYDSHFSTTTRPNPINVHSELIFDKTEKN